ncbi:helix-turn-helix domain-containing protein [Rhizobium halophytocola]|uniref:Transcriptional regulator with XRE-family HTH domain n=1 Tax=Rhizobium halophytocola TaxID=735519 RepID=A0ABS4E5D8_9HYPH|nr:helix-turn-helix transcriptional regulator [Rhizobium halophytocola]MBP1853164.1 transcriptional regulator with XRE-family HTH domain [Rhizobium halophytocola]
MDKRDRAELFRTRLDEAMRDAGVSRSALARTAGVDRSTIAQLLEEGGEARLPNAQLAAECADALRVSADWLLGLSARRQTAADLLESSLRITEADRTFADQQIDDWHREAAGYKIRHVPATLPDILKTDAVLQFEYAAFRDKTPQQAMMTARLRSDWLNLPGSDYEMCASRELLESLARGEGYWRGLDKAARVEQLEHMAAICRDRYPSLRLYLFDTKTVFSAPVTIFGPLLAAVYIGRYYMVFRESQQIRALTDHFDQLVRDCDTDARHTAAYIRSLI